MSTAEGVLAVLLGVWLAGSVAGQFPGKLVDRLRRIDLFSLLPIWTFFAPNPGTTDTHLIYRDLSRDGATRPWQELPLVPARRWTMAFWYPRKRSKKVVSDVLNSFATYLEQQERAELTPEDTLALAMVTTPYLIVLNVVTGAPRAEDVVSRQFALVERCGYFGDEPPRLVLLSPFHRLNRPPVTPPPPPVIAAPAQPSLP